MEKLLVAIDGSKSSKKAVKEAVKLAELSKADITLLHVTMEGPLREIPPQSVGDVEMAKERIKEQKEKADKEGYMILDEAEALIDNQDIDVKKKLMYGNPADIICTEAEEGDYDLILMGDKGLSGVARFFVGSITTKVVRYAPISVLVVK